VEAISPEFVVAQMESVLSDLRVGAIKTGMLATAPTVSAVARKLKAGAACPIVVDPVMVATSGDVLLAPDAIDALRQELVPLAALITPNLPEAARLLGARVAGSEDEAVAQAKALHALGARAVLVKGGHGSGDAAIDYLYDGDTVERLARPRIATPHTHGTGCVLSAAIAALLAQGIGLKEAVTRAKAFVWQGLQAGTALGVGGGRGPVDTLFAIRGGPRPA
jgi:hydroxymethylpyrimidine/phosphomethylpyrimidine kinase